MSIKQQRLARGWTQAQLAEFSGLSQRTIQRLEKGSPATLETLKCLASVFETDIATLGLTEAVDEAHLSDQEETELKHIRALRHFAMELVAYLVCVPLICLASYLNGGSIRNGLGLALAWGLWLAYRALHLFDSNALLGKRWEKQLLDKRMARQLEKKDP